jgi:hypothetical protein
MAEAQAETPQAEFVPNVSEVQLAHQAALRIIASEEPADPKAAEPKAEAAPAQEAPAEGEAPAAEAAPAAEVPPEIDWAKIGKIEREFEIKGEGGVTEKVKLPLEELVPGYMRQQDYQRKTAELARAREAAADEIRKAVEPKAKELDEKLQTYDAVLVSALAAETKGVNLDQLAQENLAAWAQAVQRINNLGAAINQVRNERAQLAQRQHEAQKETLQKAARAAVEELQRDVPGWSNDLYANVLKAGRDYGFSAEELNAITDPRAIKVLNDARQFRELKSAKPVVEKRVAEVPKVVKPGKAEVPDASAEKWNKGMASLRKSGSTQDAVQLARMMIERTG